MNYQEIDEELKYILTLIPTSPFCSNTKELQNKLLLCTNKLKERIRKIARILDEEFIGTYQEHRFLRELMHKIMLRYNKFIDIQAKYESIDDPITKIAVIANQGIKEMYKNSMIELSLLSD